MIITWHGFSCFKIQETRQSGEVTLVTDPFETEGAAKLPRNLAADIVTVSHDGKRHNAVDAVSGIGDGEKNGPFVITGPGEYEVKDMFVTGVPTFHETVDDKEKGTVTMYRINVGELHMVHLGALKHPLDEKFMEDFHDVDVLFVPVGGEDVLTAKQAAAVVQQIEPRIIIPMHYKNGDVGADLATVEAFVKALGLPKPEVLPKLKLSKKDLPQDEMRLVLLDPQ
ncbi:MAG: hypothetical protein RLZZ324_771 [Candidatus Parcubacteria bacterium]|jgi:L-ascorbate metabolism protein UlaG (beta-lactamase superfamily)